MVNKQKGYRSDKTEYRLNKKDTVFTWTMTGSGIHINDLFLWCNDIEKMRQFYTDILGLKEESYQPNASNYGHQWLSYELSNGQKLVFNSRSKTLPQTKDWSYQPSSMIDTGIEKFSWTLEMPTKHFRQVVKRLKQNEYTTFQVEPEERSGYTALTILDPMGNTIDLYHLQD